MKIIKRDGKLEEFSKEKIKNALTKCFSSVNPGKDFSKEVDLIYDSIWNNDLDECSKESISVEAIQNAVEKELMFFRFYKEAKAYILYRDTHKQSRFIKKRLDYMNNYSQSNDNAASLSETDINANVVMKNVANLEGEVYKTTNRVIQRQRMKDELNVLFPEVAKQYERDLNNHIIYTHDEASTPVLKPYCMAVTLYPLMAEGVGNIDGVTPSAPNDIQSFSGQVTNVAFLLSSQCKGAVAFGDYFIALNYYVIKEFGERWYEKTDAVISTDYCLKQSTIESAIKKGMKQFIYGINQPAGNRSFQSPFINLSYYDKNYFTSLFEDFYYPDGTQPQWEAIDKLQRIFMKLHRDLRLIKPLTFPVTTIAMVHNNKDIIDKSYKELCAEEWSKGGSFFAYINNNPTSLASCCRVLNEMSENTFSSTTGMTGIMTGSCNVITLNINRIVQRAVRSISENSEDNYRKYASFDSDTASMIKEDLIFTLERVYKYHIAYKTMLYNLEEKGMIAASNGGYIYMKKLYSTIGVIGYFEAAKFLNIDTSNNQEYINFLRLIFGTIKEQNKLHSIHDKKKPFLFNSEAIPGESLGVKLYNWDKADNYYVPEDQNLYNCYFYNPWNDTSVLDKLKLHGKEVASFCDGGQAAHINLDSHLSKEQYLKLIDYTINSGTNYYTFNIPMSECKDCGHVVAAPIKECPICRSNNIDWWVRIIGYLRPISAFGNDRQIEAGKRVYNKNL